MKTTDWPPIRAGSGAQPLVKGQLRFGAIPGTLFVLTHELSHVRYGHRVSGSGEHLLADEILADQNAFMLLQEAGRTLMPAAQDPVRKAFIAAPIVWLTIEAARTSGAGQREKIVRRGAILNLMSKEDRDEATEMVEPDHSQFNLGRLRTTWNQVPEHLFLDGLRMASFAIRDKVLIVAAGQHVVIGTRAGELCYASTIVEGHGEATLTLRCVELHDGEVAELEYLGIVSKLVYQLRGRSL
jgi:hypothetical protein